MFVPITSCFHYITFLIDSTVHFTSIVLFGWFLSSVPMIFSRNIISSLSNIYNGAFLWKQLATFCLLVFSQKGSIIDVWEGPNIGQYTDRISPFVPEAPFLYPLKTSGSLTFVFRGKRNDALRKNRLNLVLWIIFCMQYVKYRNFF